jgi:GntR family transcriptional regulator, transcriptional repressor for pyruvate dehydrogenase complex
VTELRLADRAYSEIVSLISSRNIQVGERLPSEGRLAEQFGVSRTIVREALVRLASDGVTEARRGSGSFVKRRPSERLANHVPLSDLSSALGTFEVRMVVEAQAASLAALRRSSEQMAEIEGALEALRSALHACGPAHLEDIDLHRAIVRATANPVFVSVFDLMQADIDRIMRAGVDISRSRPPEAIAAMISEHEMIVEAIGAQDAEAAALAMRWHLSQGRKRLMP